MTWIQDEINPGRRAWEEYYRLRWQHQGINCIGGFTWRIYVKEGIVTWEWQWNNLA